MNKLIHSLLSVMSIYSLTAMDTASVNKAKPKTCPYLACCIQKNLKSNDALPFFKEHNHIKEMTIEQEIQFHLQYQIAQEIYQFDMKCKAAINAPQTQLN